MINAPPMKVAKAGTSESSTQARAMAKGDSSVLSKAVSPDGTRLAPSDRVTEAIAKIRPKAARDQHFFGRNVERIAKPQGRWHQKHRCKDRRPCCGRCRCPAVDHDNQRHAKRHPQSQQVTADIDTFERTTDDQDHARKGRCTAQHGGLCHRFAKPVPGQNCGQYGRRRVNQYHIGNTGMFECRDKGSSTGSADHSHQQAPTAHPRKFHPRGSP